jgi:hypothetical protein
MASIGGDSRGKFPTCAGARAVLKELEIVAALACGLPARRVARFDPVESLRFE